MKSQELRHRLTTMLPPFRKIRLARFFLFKKEVNAMKSVRKERCYNSGKIGGLTYITAMNNFKAADDKISKMGLTPVNPLNNGLKPTRPWCMHMVVDILLMFTCASVFFQSNWQSSKGARIEYRLAKFTGMVIWLEDNPGCEN